MSGREELTASEVNAVWQDIKQHEKPRESVLEGIPATLLALLLADKVLERLERAGVEPSAADDSTAIGERLLAVVADVRAAGVDPEQALCDVVRRRAQARPSV